MYRGGGDSFGKRDIDDFDDLRSDLSGGSDDYFRNRDRMRFKDTISELYDEGEKEAVF